MTGCLILSLTFLFTLAENVEIIDAILGSHFSWANDVLIDFP